MSDEPRYTLAEARREMSRQECALHGHSWDVIEQFGTGLPVRVICSRCGKSCDVAAPAGADSE